MELMFNLTYCQLDEINQFAHFYDKIWRKHRDYQSIRITTPKQQLVIVIVIFIVWKLLLSWTLTHNTFHFIQKKNFSKKYFLTWVYRDMNKAVLLSDQSAISVLKLNCWDEFADNGLQEEVKLIFKTNQQWNCYCKLWMTLYCSVKLHIITF